MREDLILVGLGPHARPKYIPLIKNAVASGRASGFHVVELESARDDVDAFFRTRACKLASVSWVPDLRRQAIWYSGHGEDVLKALAGPGTKVIVSTEPKAHLGYLRAALGLGLDCLVDKPAVLPMGANGRPAANHLELKEICNRTGGRCVVMAPRRYKAIYELIGRYARRTSRHLGTPITYIGFEHHEGVWNTEEEILSREDHPYRYGYGMLCHSGYHHVDILASLLAHNEDTFGSLAVELDVHRATAADQLRQIGPDPVRRLRGPAPLPGRVPPPPFWGETDLVSAGAARRCGSFDTVCLFRLDLLPTSVSLRNWRQLPRNVYNTNGRYASEAIRLNIGPFAAIEARILKRPHLGHRRSPAIDQAGAHHAVAERRFPRPRSLAREVLSRAGHTRPKRGPWRWPHRGLFGSRRALRTVYHFGANGRSSPRGHHARHGQVIGRQYILQTCASDETWMLSMLGNTGVQPRRPGWLPPRRVDSRPSRPGAGCSHWKRRDVGHRAGRGRTEGKVLDDACATREYIS
ncbi:hypothetical protein IVB30_31970 [Bradyrhizobium sp. 200]|uniref:hypothetical protein n=1 Tax=Bradyrhizobium sp. 200 TaxID=2782665 RepID=UPI001FFF0AEA|nr:hypothetical protein [Bradyrhizobium sp. 200]UPJ47798.1 hypothetical protein IVB30_31970 [Bradyrhizobium sp. 200]